MLFRITGCLGQPDAFGANQRVRPESRSGPASAAGKMTQRFGESKIQGEETA